MIMCCDFKKKPFYHFPIKRYFKKIEISLEHSRKKSLCPKRGRMTFDVRAPYIDLF